MRLFKKKKSELERRLKVRVASERIERKVAPRLRSIAAGAKLKGFRKGKAPLAMIETIYGPEVRRDAVDDLMREALVEQLESEGLRPAEPPRVENARDEGERGVEFEFVFEIYPRIGEVDFERIHVDHLQPEVADSDVDRLLVDLRLRHAEWNEVARAAETDDRVSVVLDGIGVDSGVKHFDRRQAQLIVGRGRLPCGLEERLEGMRAGERCDVEGQLAEDFPGLERIGERNLKLHLELNKVEESVLPKLDQTFFEKCGIEVESESEFRQGLHQQLMSNARAEAKRRLADELFDKLDEAHADLPLPAKMVADEIRSRHPSADAAEVDAAEVASDVVDADVDDQVRAVAEKRVRLSLVVRHLMETFGIEVAAEEVRAVIEEMSASYGEQAAQMAQIYMSSEEFVNSVHSKIAQDRLVERLLEKVNIAKKNIACEELLAERRGGGA